VPAAELARATLHERNYILSPKSGSSNWPTAKTFGDESVNVPSVIFQRVSGASAFFQQVTPILICKTLRRSRWDFFGLWGHTCVSEDVEQSVQSGPVLPPPLSPGAKVPQKAFDDRLV
jgi:hypothetical protein